MTLNPKLHGQYTSGTLNFILFFEKSYLFFHGNKVKCFLTYYNYEKYFLK